MQLESILERNRGFVRGHEARPLPPAESIGLAVVACYDPRLDTLLREALGLEPGEGFLFRTAGALLQPGGPALRSLGLAVFMFGVTEVLVVGHTSCRMARFESSAFIDSFRKRGVPRQAFGTEDLRQWAGAIPDPRRGVAMSVANILSAEFLPKDLSVAGLVLDDTTGALEVVVKPGDVVPAAAISTEAVATSSPIMPQETSLPRVEPVSTPAGEFPVAEIRAAAPKDADPLVEAVRGFVRTLQSTQRWRDEIKIFRQTLDHERNPLVKLRMLESLASRAATDSREVRDAFARVQREASARGRLKDPEELFRLFRQLTAGS